MKQYNARPDVKAKKAKYNARPEVKAKRAEQMKQRNNQQCMARLEVKTKRAEQMKQYNQQNEMVPRCHWCGLEVKAKRAEQMKQYNQQYKDVAEQAETSKLGPFGADPFGLTFGADPPVALPPIGKEDRKEALEEFR